MSLCAGPLRGRLAFQLASFHVDEILVDFHSQMSQGLFPALVLWAVEASVELRPLVSHGGHLLLRYHLLILSGCGIISFHVAPLPTSLIVASLYPQLQEFS